MTMTLQHGLGPPSAWLLRWAHLLAPGSRVLDVACGSGRHARWLAAQGHAVTALDRDAQALQGLYGVAAEVVCADIEHAPWPLPGRAFDAIIVTNYLWRPLVPQLLAAVAQSVWLFERAVRLQRRAQRRHGRDHFVFVARVERAGKQLAGRQGGQLAGQIGQPALQR